MEATERTGFPLLLLRAADKAQPVDGGDVLTVGAEDGRLGVSHAIPAHAREAAGRRMEGGVQAAIDG